MLCVKLIYLLVGKVAKSFHPPAVFLVKNDDDVADVVVVVVAACLRFCLEEGVKEIWSRDTKLRLKGKFYGWWEDIWCVSM